MSAYLSGQEQFELMNVEISHPQNPEIISKKVSPLSSQIKLINYDSLNMSYAGSWSLGQSFCIKNDSTGNIVFCGSGAGVIILDMTDPYNPIKLSEIHARALIDDVFYKQNEDRLYLSAYFSGLEIWDVSDLTQPYRLSRIETSGLPRGGVYVPEVPAVPGQLTTAFAVTVADGVDVFMVDWDGQPTFVTNQNFTGSALIWTSFGYNDILFLSSGSTGTKAIDVDVTSGTYFTNIFNVPGQSTSISAQNDLLYIVDYSSGLKIHSFESIPVTFMGQLSISGYPYRICTSGDLAYIANSTTNPGGGINILDISDPEVPADVGHYDNPNTYIAGSEDAIYATGGMDGCLILDVADPENPVYASNINLPLSVNDIAVKENYAYTGSNGFRVFDVSDKSNPVQVGYEETQGALVKVHGNYAVYCPKSMGSGNKVNIMDVSDPTNPTNLGHYNAPVMTYDIDLKGTYAFVACWWDGFRVVDYSDPENPVLVAHELGWTNGAIPGEEFCYVQALEIEGDYLYVVDYGPFEDEDTKGIYIFDISDPTSPEFINRMPSYQGKAYDIEVSNGYACLADSEGGLNIVNVNEPLFPYEESYLPLGDVAWAVDIFGCYAFVANYINEGVQVIDICDPANPSIEGYYKRTGCFALNVTYDAGHVFVADGPAGIQIYNFDLLSNTPEISAQKGFNYNIYPNPSNDMVSIEIKSDTENSFNICLFDLAGKKLESIAENLFINNSQSVTFKKDIYPSGIYFIKITSTQTSVIEKIILL